MADPVKLATRSLHKAPNYGTGFAPYFIPLSLWVGAMVAYMLIQPLNRRALAAGASGLADRAGRLAAGRRDRRCCRSLALMAVLHWAARPGDGARGRHRRLPAAGHGLLRGDHPVAERTLRSRPGRILVLAVLMLQLTSAGGTYPVQTSPGFFNAIHPFLPMSYVVDGLRRLITGGDLGPVWQGCAVLVAFTAGALALTALVARGAGRCGRMDRLHPELSL